MSYLMRRKPLDGVTRTRGGLRRRPSLELLEGRALMTAGIAEFPAPLSNPTGLAVGGDGNFWVLGMDATGGNTFSVVAPDGAVKATYHVPTTNADAASPALGPDGNLWFVETTAGKIGKVTPDGVFSEYALPNATGDAAPVDLNTPSGPPGVVAWPTSIVAGADGAMWFTEMSANAIGRITTDGTITQKTLTPGTQPNSIALGPDKLIWFTDNSYNNTVDRINADGTISTFTLPENGIYPMGLTTGPGGALWFVGNGNNAVGRITTDGAVTEIPIRGNLASPQALTFDATGNMWVTGYGGTIARITPQGFTTVLNAQPGQSGSSTGAVTGPDGAIWFLDTSSNQLGRVDPTTIAPAVTDDALFAGPEWANGAGTFGTLTFGDALGSFYDGNPSGVASDFTATIHWGDGTTDGAAMIAAVAPGQFTVTGTHTFARFGTYNATVTITDVNPAHTPHPNGLTLSTSINVSDQSGGACARD